MARECHECCATIYAGEGGIRAHGKLFCSEDCADAFEDSPTSREIDELYPEWSGAMPTTSWDEF